MASPNPPVAILAGGLASRLGELSAAVPKSMIEVAGKPFIAHQLRRLAREEFREVVICAGHLGEAIQAFVDDGSAFGCRVRYSFDGGRPLGTGGALRKALPLLGKSFVTLYGDSYLRVELLPVWKRFGASGKPALMTLFHNEGRWGPSNVEFANGEILRYDKLASSAAMRHIDYGLSCIQSGALSAFAAEGAAFDLASFFAAMVQQRQLAAYEVSDRFYEIGSPEGLRETDALLREALRDPASAT